MIGIDFGTTNSAIAHVLARGDTAPIPDPVSSESILPSVVYYESPDRVIVGRAAKDQYYELINQPNVPIFKSIKRRLKDNWTYNVYGRSVHDTEIASQIFSALRRRAETVLDMNVTSAVVTIPVYFDADERSAVRKAARLAGIEVRGFLHEPVAAVYKYCHDFHHTQRVLVFDWGGGTLDISILKIDNGMMTELEVGGDSALGGDDIDINIANDSFHCFLDASGLQRCSLEENPVCFQRLVTRSETAKILLSDPENPHVAIDIVSFYRGKDLSRNLTRKDFEKINRQVFKNAIDRTLETMGKVQLTPRDLDQVVLAGGSSRIPHLVKLMEDIFGPAKVKTLVNADTCVAEGAALMSYSGFDPVLAVPVGIELDNGVIHTFLNKGTSVLNPTARQIRLFVTDPRGGTANIKIFESESGRPDARDSRLKKILSVPINRRHPEYVEVKFELDSNQCLKISAHGLETMRKEVCEIKDVKVGFKLNGRN
jgi:molecular chaperone DnaK